MRGEAGEVLEGSAWMQSWRGGRGGYDSISPPRVTGGGSLGEERLEQRTVESAESRAWYTQ